ncbi:MAG: spore maturation protein [Desulfobacteraceae bacterium]|nr:spore maturation protein [Desulfobacteraceae bacterium]
MPRKPSAINLIWLAMILAATVTAAYNGRMPEVTQAVFASAKEAVTLAIGLIGPMALWLGLVKIAETGGLMHTLARGLRPVMTRLFPEIPADHPALAAMILNLAANLLGLGNAATPLGIKAMQELDRLSADKGTATNAMCLFLALNTASITLLPLSIIAVRAGAGASAPAAILLPTLLATLLATLVAITACKLLATPDQGLATLADPPSLPAAEAGDQCPRHHPPAPPEKLLVIATLLALTGGAIWQLYRHRPLSLSPAALNAASAWLTPLLIVAFLVYGHLRGVKVYEVATEGAKEGFATTVRIIPFLVAIFVAIGMLRASGALDLLIRLLSPVTSRIGMPAEALSVALLRPLSGSGSFALMSELVAKAPDSFLSFLVSTMQGSTETTFYVLAVYFGSVGITRTRHALPAALCADAAGLLGAVFICRLLWTG